MYSVLGNPFDMYIDICIYTNMYIKQQGTSYISGFITLLYVRIIKMNIPNFGIRNNDSMSECLWLQRGWNHPEIKKPASKDVCSSRHGCMQMSPSEKEALCFDDWKPASQWLWGTLFALSGAGPIQLRGQVASTMPACLLSFTSVSSKIQCCVRRGNIIVL